MEDYAKVFVAAAKEMKVKLIVRMSAMGANALAQGEAAYQGKADTHFKDSGIPYILIHPCVFMSNVFFQAKGLKHGEIHVSTADGRSAYIAPEDIGALTAAVMTFPELGLNRGYDVKGAYAHTDAEFYAAVGNAIGHPIAVINLTPDEHKKLLESWGMAPQLAENLVAMDTIRRLGWAAQTDQSEFQHLVGRPQLTIAEWIQKHIYDLKQLASA